MLPIIQFNLHFDRKTWDAFKARVRKDYGKTAIDAIRYLVDYVIKYGLPEPPAKKKDKDKTDA